MKKASGYRFEASGSVARAGYGTRYHAGALREAASSPTDSPKPRPRSLNNDGTNSNGTCRGGSRTAQSRAASTTGSEGRTWT